VANYDIQSLGQPALEQICHELLARKAYPEIAVLSRTKRHFYEVCQPLLRQARLLIPPRGAECSMKYEEAFSWQWFNVQCGRRAAAPAGAASAAAAPAGAASAAAAPAGAASAAAAPAGAASAAAAPAGAAVFRLNLDRDSGAIRRLHELFPQAEPVGFGRDVFPGGDRPWLRGVHDQPAPEDFLWLGKLVLDGADPESRDFFAHMEAAAYMKYRGFYYFDL
jgi:hypothetical protein